MGDTMILQLAGAFAPIFALAGSPFIALALISAAGCLLNAGIINPAHIPMSHIFMELPTANYFFLGAILFVLAFQYLLGTTAASKIFSQATLDNIESVIGAACALFGMYYVSRDMTATDIARSYGIDIALTAASVGISLLMSAVSLVIYMITNTMARAIDMLAMVAAPIPGASFVLTNFKFAGIIFFMLLALFAPAIAAVLGVLIFIIACFVYKKTRRLEIYYRNIYIKPLFNAIFKYYDAEIVPKKTPREILSEFEVFSICIDGFFMNKKYGFYKRERCYFIRADGRNYLFNKRRFSRVKKIEMPDNLFYEKHFRFICIFSDDLKKDIHFIIRREHAANLPYLSEHAGFIEFKTHKEEERNKKLIGLKLEAF
jgi:hypothetical protein